MARITNLDFLPGKEKSVVSEVPMNFKIVTMAGGVIEIKISPHQEIKFTAPPGGWDLEVIQLLVEEDQPPRRPRLVKETS